MSAPTWLPRAKRMFLDGKSYNQIGEAIGISGNAVGKTFRRHKVNLEVKALQVDKPPPWIEQAKAMMADGVPWRQISRDLGVPAYTIRSKIEPGYREARAEENKRYLQSGGWGKRMDRERAAYEAEEMEARERPRSSARELMASRFYNFRPGVVRYGR